CVQCQIGQFSLGGSSACENCVGSHSEFGSFSCIDTPSGHFFDSFFDEGVIEGMIYMVRGARREAKQNDEEVGNDIETPGGIEMRPMGGFDDSGDRLRAQSTGETGLGGDVVSKHEKYAGRAAEGELLRKQTRMDQLKGSYSNTKNLKKGGSGVGEKKKEDKEFPACETFSSFPPPKKKTSGGGGQLPPGDDDDFAPPPQNNKLWDIHHSEEHEADYYVHRESGETVWERPPGV
ncbi:hypothetical protein ScalyP_jg10036, partial [Parmales sp. scaly parma]